MRKEIELSVPPNDKEIEIAVLGAILLERDAIEAAVGIIHTPEIFYDKNHLKIYSAIIEMFRSGYMIDLLTVTDFLRGKNWIDEVGGAYYLTTLTMAVISSAHIDIHCMILVEKWIRREQLQLSYKLQKMANDNTQDCFETLEYVEKLVFDLNGGSALKKVTTAKMAGMEAAEHLAKVRTLPGGLVGLDTGYPVINAETSGWQQPDLNILAARPGVGKTSMALNFAVHASNKGTGVLIFSLEMGADQLVKRLASIMYDMQLKAVTNPKIASVDEFNFIVNGLMSLPENIYIDDSANVSVSQMRTKAMKIMSKNPIGLIIIDYLQLMGAGTTNKNANRENIVSGISRDLKVMAKELKVPIIALSQLNRAGEKDEPQLSNLRESGAIEQDADMVMFLWSPYSPDDIAKDPDKGTELKFKVAKNRHGTTLSDYLHFDKSTQVIRSLSQMPMTMPPQSSNPAAGITNTKMFNGHQPERTDPKITDWD